MRVERKTSATVGRVGDGDALDPVGVGPRVRGDGGDGGTVGLADGRDDGGTGAGAAVHPGRPC